MLITGHTGFKGSWLTALLLRFGSEVTGYALEPPTDPSLFKLSKLEGDINSIRGDIRDYDHLLEIFRKYRPEIVFHMAAQPLVRLSYREPRLTYDTNVMGTVNVLECVRNSDSVRSVVNVTTDKVYLNPDDDIPFTEGMELNGYDPYSNSKSCSELVTWTYVRSFFGDKASTAISTARAGNVIGGGDFAADRLIPDSVRAAEKGSDIIIRNPKSTRPFQHVLEPLMVYLEIASKQWDNKEKYAGAYNVGPDLEDIKSVSALVELFCKYYGEGLRYRIEGDGGPHEASCLRLDNRKIKEVLNWKSVWGVEEAVKRTAIWSKRYIAGEDVRAITEEDIEAYLRDSEREFEV